MQSNATSSAPARIAWVLGLAGVLPFWGALVLYLVGPPRLAGPALLGFASYSAIILSFLGGIRWGAAMQGPASAVALSVIGALVGWGALLLSDPQVAIALLGLAHLLQLGWDLFSPPPIGWFRPLRATLTGLALAAHAVFWMVLVTGIS